MSGAKNCPETPRQKMIGMMYLVLTAMLALNVSADILNGFNRIRHSLESADKTTVERTADVLANFEATCAKDEGTRKKYGEWLEIAKKVHEESDAFYQYVETFKMDIIHMVDKKAEHWPEKFEGGDNTHAAHLYALNGVPGSRRADALKERMAQYINYMTVIESGCIKDRYDANPKFAHDWDLKTDMFKALFNTDPVQGNEGQMLAWENSIFHEMPAAAVIAVLTKYQNDIRLAENDMISFLFAQGGTSSMSANFAQALVMSETPYVLQGNHYKAKIVSALVDTNALPRFFINGKEYDGYYDVVASSVGEQTFTGYMLLPEDSTRYPFEGKYTVGAPSATISNVDLNVMYEDYDNKFSVSVPGVAPNKVRVSLTNATCTQENGLYVVKVKKGSKEVTMETFAEIDGKQQLMSTQKFSVKPLKKSSSFFTYNGQDYDDENPVKKDYLLNSNGYVRAGYPSDEVLQMDFEVRSFAILFPNQKIVSSKGNHFSPEQIKEIRNVKAGQTITIRNILTRSKTGAEGSARSVTIQIK